MLFNSLHFLFFFPVVVAFYFAMPYRWRWALLLGASYYFYMVWKPEYIILIIASTLIDYVAGLKMEEAKTRKRRRAWLIVSLFSNLGMLFAFKYFNFFNDQTRAVFDSLNIFYGVPDLKILLPVGISFYTFQTLSYSIDIYRGQRQAERHLGIFALYVSFFPQLVAGPIERSTRLLPQFREKHDFNYHLATNGLKLMLWGFFKKLVIADRLDVYVSLVYNNPGEFQGVPVILATYFFAFQIYCDFSGYSDIAIGASQVMGYRLMDNFNRPYFSKSIAEFWKRWHISLSTWFRDYLYISLGGNRVAKWRWYANLLIVFLLSGLWHGANWTFLAWGGLHGSYLVLAIWTSRWRTKMVKIFGLSNRPRFLKSIQVFITFHLVCLAWVFFRANNVRDALTLIRDMAQIDWSALPGINIPGYAFGRYELSVAFLAIAFMEGVHLLQRHNRMREMLSDRPVWVRWGIYYALVLAILFFGQFQARTFIYFQF